MRSLLLFTRDLRVHDHPALAAAVEGGAELLPLFVLEPRLLSASPNRARFLFACLQDLDRRLARLGTPLVLRKGDAATVAAGLAGRTGCRAVFVTSDASGHAARRERRLHETCESRGIEVHTVPGHAVVEPGAVTPAGGGPAYRVFTPYLRAWSAAEHREPLPPPRRLRSVEGVARPALPHPADVRRTAPLLPRGGEIAGRSLLARFLRTKAAAYGRDHDRLDLRATSCLSPYLRFGCISAAEVVHRAGLVPESSPFVRQLAWRDFFLQLLAADRRLTECDLRPRRAPAWADDPAAFDAWRHAETGHPLVDAAMRQLLREGWMPNRARLVAASYLTRTLGIDWRDGAAHFARHLVDGDPASNAGNWQWVAGTGANPRGGVALNPDRQARRFDPLGDYAEGASPR
jgi:deoxyribodipyrimidine photo-lyase